MKYFLHFFLINSLLLCPSFITCSEEIEQVFSDEILLQIASNYNTFDDFYNLARTNNSMYQLINEDFEDRMLCLHDDLDTKIKKAKKPLTFNTIKKSKGKIIFSDRKKNNLNFRTQLNILHQLFYTNNIPIDNPRRSLPIYYKNIAHAFFYNKLPLENTSTKEPFDINILKVTPNKNNKRLYHFSLDHDAISGLQRANYNDISIKHLNMTTKNNTFFVNKFFFNDIDDLTLYMETLDKNKKQKTIFSLNPCILFNSEVELYSQFLEKKIWFDAVTLQKIAFKALCENDDSIISLLLCYPNFDPDKQIQGMRLVNIAYQTNLINIVKLFIENGANPNKRDFNSKTLITYILEKDDMQTFKTLLTYNINFDDVDDVTAINILYKNKKPALFHALDKKDNSEYYKLALQNLLDNLKTNSHAAANSLCHACQTENFELIKLLLKNGADIKAKNYLKVRPFFIACWTGNMEIITYLYNTYSDQININSKNGYDKIITKLTNFYNDMKEKFNDQTICVEYAPSSYRFYENFEQTIAFLEGKKIEFVPEQESSDELSNSNIKEAVTFSHNSSNKTFFTIIGIPILVYALYKVYKYTRE